MDKFINLDEEKINILKSIGITKLKCLAIEETAKYLMYNNIDFNHCFDSEKEIKNLMELRGIGKWTAEYISIRAIKNTNIFLTTDYSIKKILKEYSKFNDRKLHEKLSPYKSYVTISLWNYFERLRK